MVVVVVRVGSCGYCPSVRGCQFGFVVADASKIMYITLTQLARPLILLISGLYGLMVRCSSPFICYQCAYYCITT